jgi:hypothetical protein
MIKSSAESDYQFLELLFQDIYSDLDGSYREKVSEATMETEPILLGMLLVSDFSELGIITTAKLPIKSKYDDAHNLAARKLLKATDIEAHCLFEAARPRSPVGIWCY